MNNMQLASLNTNYKILGAGLLALDIILNGKQETPPKIQTGGSCGNVLTILAYLGFSSYPISRLGSNNLTQILLEDIHRWNVNSNLISIDTTGSTPVIIHRIKKDKSGKPTHRFEFKNPFNGNWLPRYKPVLASSVENIIASLPDNVNVFYFDRVSRSSIELAKHAKSIGAMIFFEPSGYNNLKLFKECLAITDVLKFSNDRIKNYSEVFESPQVKLEIETLGADGINYRYKSNDWKHVPSFTFSNIIDTAGAGDWCTAGIISQLVGYKSIDSLESKKIEAALNYGQVLGGLSCGFDGARGMMYHSDLATLSEATEQIVKRRKEVVLNKPTSKESILSIKPAELEELLGAQ